jgi:hypothetical protein
MTAACSQGRVDVGAKIFILKSSWRIQGWPPPWCSNSMRRCLPYTHEYSFRVHFPSLDMLLGILSLPTLEFLHITEPFHEVVLSWLISLPQNFECHFQLYHVDFFFDGIVGANSLGPILIPLVLSLGDLSLERVLLMLFFNIVHSCSSH